MLAGERRRPARGCRAGRARSRAWPRGPGRHRRRRCAPAGRAAAAASSPRWRARHRRGPARAWCGRWPARRRRRPGCRRTCRRGHRCGTASSSSARPVSPASGSPPAMPLAVVIRSGTTPSCSEANHCPVRQKPVWISSAMKTAPALAAPVGQRRQEARRRDDEAALALDRLDEHAGDVGRPDLRLDHRDRAGGGLLAGQARLVAERVGHRHPVDLARERPEAVLVGHVLRGQRHREVGPAVVGVVEDDDGLPAGGQPGDLDRVLHGLGAGVEQRRALLVVAGGQPGQLLADGDVPLVRPDHEAGVGEGGHLRLDRGDDLGARSCRRW